MAELEGGYSVNTCEKCGYRIYDYENLRKEVVVMAKWVIHSDTRANRGENEMTVWVREQARGE